MNEDKYKNNLFYTCSLIELISRKTKNTKKYIVDCIGKTNIQNIYELAEAYHSENIYKIVDEIINKYNIKENDYDILTNIKNENPPTYWDMGKVYKRLIVALSNNESEYIDKLVEVLTSWIIPKLDNYDSSLYYENPSYILECYKENKII